MDICVAEEVGEEGESEEEEELTKTWSTEGRRGPEDATNM